MTSVFDNLEKDVSPSNAGIIETLVTASCHSLTGLVIGTVVDEMFPDYSETKSDFILGVEAIAQFGLGFLALSEVMNVLIPKNSYYSSPIGDGAVMYWFFSTQHQFLKKIKKLKLTAVASIKGSVLSSTPHPNTELPVIPASSK